ncbi:hypothetical protein SRABI76_00738 [Microbacterium oxydans]|uniref:DUF402 domain-containing protein n=1 Tax=Microbacterium oxydans TaxID=82380 RepID=A0A0F0L8M0_9MICO|nr:DUF402 domain-containing protein [Microbacterium oxydans]KJL27886.1 hypothetical protein RS83_02946 [Microbacterium oxydans]CAH0148746.1 hypothetical protein SRABI76_00738 [Microbacterium oxydans]
MRTPLRTTGVSASGGTVELVGRRGADWAHIATTRRPLAEAIAELDSADQAAAHADPAYDRAVASSSPAAPRFAIGQQILWRYGRVIETARVVRDDDRGLVAWTPSASARLDAVPADGRHPREVPLEERFLVPWHAVERAWTGPGILRVAPTGKPWSVWFFRREDGTADGVYVNIELPHRRISGEEAAVFTRDLVLDLWIDAEHRGEEDVWLKDADELAAAVDQGRFSPEQAEAVRVLADHAGAELIMDAAWPLDDGWDQWVPDADADVPLELPETAATAAARTRSGRRSLEG